MSVHGIKNSKMTHLPSNIICGFIGWLCPHHHPKGAVTRPLFESKISLMHVLPCKWVFKMKVTNDAVPKYKVRLVAKEFKQEKGMDFNEIFLLVMKTTFKCVPGLVAKEDMELK